MTAKRSSVSELGMLPTKCALLLLSLIVGSMRAKTVVPSFWFGAVPIV